MDVERVLMEHGKQLGEHEASIVALKDNQATMAKLVEGVQALARTTGKVEEKLDGVKQDVADIKTDINIKIDKVDKKVDDVICEKRTTRKDVWKIILAAAAGALVGWLFTLI